MRTVSTGASEVRFLLPANRRAGSQGVQMHTTAKGAFNGNGLCWLVGDGDAWFLMILCLDGIDTQY